MLRSMFAGVSGLRSHQTMMDTVGNNISNINTHGYKSSRTTFQDALYQTIRGATGGAEDGVDDADGDAGGVNPTQVGLGARVASIDQNFSQGGLQTTNRATDMAIDGEGFFVVSDEGEVGEGGDGALFTRNGAFSFDENGRLVTGNGQFVMGYEDPDVTDDGADLDMISADGLVDGDGDDLAISDLSDISVGNDGLITGRTSGGEEVTIGRLALANFDNPNGLTRAGNSMFTTSVNSGDPAFSQPGDGSGVTQGGVLEMSNVDLAEEFTNLIMAQRGFQANSRTITTSDEMLQELVNLKR
ncbi:MAG: flagellar hook-basal body complex protein [Egibacteraceae bacterium]